MKLRDRFSLFLFNRIQKRSASTEGVKRSIRWGGRHVDEENILESSDVYELMQDISNQMMLADITIVDGNNRVVKRHRALDVLNNPNDYLTTSEFIKLMTNTYLIRGEVFPVLDNGQLHIADNVFVDLDDDLKQHFNVNGETIPSDMIRHIKNIGSNHLHGVGLLDLGRRTLEGVMSAEKVLTDKYSKGGLMAFLLRLDAHINPANGTQTLLVNAILDQLEAIDESRSVKLIPLGKGYDIETLESPIDDEKTLSYLNVYKKDLGKFLGINVDTYTELTKIDLEKAMMYLYNKAVRPIMKNFSEHLTKLLLGPGSNLKVKFNIDILDFVPYSVKTNIGYNIVRTGITTPDDVAEMLGFERQNTEQSQKIYISKDLAEIDSVEATSDTLEPPPQTVEDGQENNERVSK